MKEIKILFVVALLGISGIIGYNSLQGEKESGLELSNAEALTQTESGNGVSCWVNVSPTSQLDMGMWVFKCVPCSYIEYAWHVDTQSTCGHNW